MIDYSVRLATRRDIPEIADVFRKAREVALSYLPDLHTPEDDRAFFGGKVMEACTIWVADAGGVIAFCAYRAGWLDHLYVHPDHLRQGIGSALLGKAMEAEPRLELWAFQRNLDAIAFYVARGFRLVERTDGEGNEEREPDVRLVWDGSLNEDEREEA